MFWLHSLSLSPSLSCLQFCLRQCSSFILYHSPFCSFSLSRWCHPKNLVIDQVDWLVSRRMRVHRSSDSLACAAADSTDITSANRGSFVFAIVISDVSIIFLAHTFTVAYFFVCFISSSLPLPLLGLYTRAITLALSVFHYYYFI